MAEQVVQVAREAQALFGDGEACDFLPRYPQLRQIMAAARKQVQIWTAADLGLGADALQPRLTIERLYVPVKQSNVEIVEGENVQEQAANLARKLREARII